MLQIFYRIVSFVLLGFLPFITIIIISGHLVNPFKRILGISAFVWLAYANSWSKRQARIMASEPKMFLEAATESRRELNAEIKLMLSLLPIVGGLFTNLFHMGSQPPQTTGEIEEKYDPMRVRKRLGDD